MLFVGSQDLFVFNSYNCNLSFGFLLFDLLFQFLYLQSFLFVITFLFLFLSLCLSILLMHNYSLMYYTSPSYDFFSLQAAYLIGYGVGLLKITGYDKFTLIYAYQLTYDCTDRDMYMHTHIRMWMYGYA